MDARQRQTDTVSLKTIAISLLPFVSIVLAATFLIVRTILFIVADYMWYEKVFALFLLLAEIFMLVHGIGYMMEIFRVLWSKRSLQRNSVDIPALSCYPPVAVIVSSFKEPLEVVENTVTTFYNLSYPNKHIFFLDDTRYDTQWETPQKMADYRSAIDRMCRDIGVNLFRRRWHGAKAGMINDFLDYLSGNVKEGYEFSNFSGKALPDDIKYIVVFDADQNPFPDFIEPLVVLMESESSLAFVQTPQYYTNFETNKIARASGFQQIVFYEYICEGKSTKGATFCCGTNVIFRREALNSVGGFDETSVTEDFVTSLKFHLKGWKTRYLNRPNAFGMGPEDLGGYFKQQFRWALGTVGFFPRVLYNFIKNRSKLSIAQWWEYFLSSTWYFIGLVAAIMMICPAVYLLFSIPTYFAKPELYLVLFVPYIVITLTTFYWTLQKRNYRLSDLITGQLLTFISFPVYLKATTLALLGVRGTFGITPKGGGKILPLKGYWVQFTMFAFCFSAIIWGANRLFFEREPFWGIAVNMFWCFYHFMILSSIFYFNDPGEDSR